MFVSYKSDITYSELALKDEIENVKIDIQVTIAKVSEIISSQMY